MRDFWIKSCAITAIALLIAIHFIMARDASPKPPALVQFANLTLSIPPTIPFRLSIDRNTKNETLVLIVPTKLLPFVLHPATGHKIVDFAIFLKNFDDGTAELSSYDRIINTSAPKVIAKYKIYEAEVFESLFVAEDDSEPKFFDCQDAWKGVLSGSPRLCTVQETLDMSGSKIVLQYGFLFEDISNLATIDMATRTLITSMVTR